MAKRALDIVLSGFFLALLSPVFLAVAVAIKLDSRGPVLHRAVRVGRDGVDFTVFKFRTMVLGADRIGPGITGSGDARVTRVGRFLRRFRFDELPQFLNVVRGDMSVVGPRPEDPRYVALYTPEQRAVLSVRPGIASPAAVKYRREEELLAAAGPEMERVYRKVILPDKLRMDLEYIEHRSILLDLVVLAQVGVGLFAPGRDLVVLLVRRYVNWALADAFVVAVAFALAWISRAITTDLEGNSALLFGALAVALYVAVNQGYGVYRRFWRYASAGEVMVLAASVAVATALLLLDDLVWPWQRPVPIGVVLETGLFVFVGFTGLRYRSRVWTGLEWRWRASRGQFPTRTRVLIVGAGESAQLLAWRFQNQSKGERYRVVGFVDDDPYKQGMRIHGFPVLGGCSTIPAVSARHRVDLIVLAIHRIEGDELRKVLELCEQTSAGIKLLPDLFRLIEDTNGLPSLRDLTPEELMGHKQASIDREACRGLIEGKTVLVTGAAGSIGSELCRQIAAFNPRRLLMLDNNESGLHDLHGGMQLESAEAAGPGEDPGGRLLPLLGDITDPAKMEALFSRHRPELLFHAAAYKHVPLMERHPEEAVRVNVQGTRVLARLSAGYGVERFVLVSTDKAINPSSVMGATKRVGEMITVGVGDWGLGVGGWGLGVGGREDPHPPAETPGRGNGKVRGTLFTAVRFGNVLSSRGSVVPLFERQIDAGGPVTVTHPEMTRYFISIPEAVSLILQAATFTEGGDVFMLDMGEGIRIDDLARRLIRLRGLRPEVDVPIVYTGIRPGEKLHEELLGEGEARFPTAHPRIFRVRGEPALEPAGLRGRVDELVALAEAQRGDEVVARLREMVGAGAGAVPTPG